MEHYSVFKKNEILPFGTTQMDLKGIMLSGKKSDKERQILKALTYMWNLKTKQNSKKTKLIDREQTAGCQKCGMGRKRNE